MIGNDPSLGETVTACGATIHILHEELRHVELHQRQTRGSEMWYSDLQHVEILVGQLPKLVNDATEGQVFLHDSMYFQKANH